MIIWGGGAQLGKTESAHAQSLSETGLARSLEACSTLDEMIKMPIQARITLAKSSRIKTAHII